MEKLKIEPLCASSEDLYTLYISNNKNLNKEDIEIEKEQYGLMFFKKLTNHFLEYHYPNTNCLVIKNGISLIKTYKSEKLNFIFHEYMIDLNSICKKTKKDFKIIVIPFEEEEDVIAFLKRISLSINLKANLWKGKETSWDEVDFLN